MKYPEVNQQNSLGPEDWYRHPLEKWVPRWWVQAILRFISADRPGTAGPHLYRAVITYGDEHAPAHERLLYWPIHQLIDRMRGSMTRPQLRAKLGGHISTVRGILSTSRSLGHYGLTTPQRWEHPLFVVWNFTNACNLRCRHCYQSSNPRPAAGELTLAEKLGLIDQLAQKWTAMVAFAGGEPTISEDLEPCLERCRQYHMHTTIATNGTLLTPEKCRRLAATGLRYIEVSLDSVHADRHDAFRGVPGMWRRSVQGIKNVVATPGLRAGLAMCVHRQNVDEVEEMIRFALGLGVSCFAHFNFIPVGRGRDMIDLDITPAQREQLLATLRRWMETRQIGIISTAPQFGRVCLSHLDPNALVSCSHAGNGAGTKARVIAKYLGGCGAGRTYACVQPNGDVTPCVYMPQRIMGNVCEKPFAQIFQQSPWWDTFCNRDQREGNCGACDFKLFCGGCRARADAYFGRLDHSDPGCPCNQDLWQQINREPTPAAQPLVV